MHCNFVFKTTQTKIREIYAKQMTCCCKPIKINDKFITKNDKSFHTWLFRIVGNILLFFLFLFFLQRDAGASRHFLSYYDLLFFSSQRLRDDFFHKGVFRSDSYFLATSDSKSLSKLQNFSQYSC